MSKQEVKSELTGKDSALFRMLIRSQQFNQSAKGLKIADQILAKHPNHGETLSIKALLLRTTGKIEEAYSAAELAVKKDPQNYLCWKICGHMYEQDKNFDRAIECYRVAVLCENGLENALRDYSAIALFKGEYDEYWRFQIKALEEGSHRKLDVAELAFSAHLNGDRKYAIARIDNLLSHAGPISKLTRNDSLPPVEGHVENLLKYKILLLEENGEYERAISEIDKAIGCVFDTVSLRETKARLLLRLNKRLPAEAEYWVLMSHNVDNMDYLLGLMDSRGLRDLDKEYNENDIIDLFNELRLKYPKSSVIWSLPLDNIRANEVFKMFAQEYIKMLFKRDSPSAFFLLRHLYQDKQKAQILHDIITKFDEDLETYGYFKSFENDNYEYKEPPTRFIAVRSCLAQSYCRLLDFKQALKVIDDAIAHTPTYSDLYAIKSNIYMSSGNTAESTEAIRIAKDLDLRDRNLIFEYVKLALRNNELEKAEKAALGLASHNSNLEKLYSDFNSIQFVSFFYEVGCYYMRNNMYEKALEKFYGILRQFAKLREDTIDFYQFSTRRGSFIIPYLDLTRNFDKFYNNSDYVHSSKYIADIYLLLHCGKICSIPNEVHTKKDQNCSQKSPSAIQGTSTLSSTRKVEPNRLMYTPEKPLLSEPNPLKAASDIVLDIILNDTKYPDIYETGYKLYIKKEKPLLALRCLLKMKEDAHLMSKARFYATELVLLLPDLQLKNRYCGGVYNLFISTLKFIISGRRDSDDKNEISMEYLIDENEKFIKSHIYDPMHTVYGLKCFYILKCFEKLKDWANLYNDSIDLRNSTHDQCVEIYQLLKELEIGDDVPDGFKNKISNIFVFSPAFQFEVRLPCVI